MAYTQSYQYQLNDIPFIGISYGQANHSATATDNSAYMSTLARTPTHHDDHLTQILRRARLSLAGKDPVEALQTSQSLSLKDRISEILQQLNLRHELNQSFAKHLKRISLETSSHLLNLESFVPFRDPSVDRRRSELESRLHGHYQEGMREQRDCWKDQQQLREQLVELVNEYRTASWRSQLVANLTSALGEHTGYGR